MKQAVAILLGLLGCFSSAANAQRRPVLQQIDEPHPYYYRELYLPQLTSGPSSLAWSPDSGELIYSMAGSLWRQKLDSTEAVQLTDGPGYDYQPDWSPDGTHVVFVRYRKDAMELWLLNLTDSKTRQLTSGGAVNVEPRWSPDGKKLVWVSTEYGKRFHVFVADFLDQELKNITRLTGETKSSLPRYYYSAYDMEISPVWTRKGNEILFVSNKGHIYGTGGFWKIKTEPGAEAREIHYEETSWKARPDFSPDGSRIIYSSYLGRQWHNIWILPENGGDAFPLTYADGDETNARWSPDGKSIAFLTNKSGSPVIHIQQFPGDEGKDIAAENRNYRQPRYRLLIGMDNRSGQPEFARVSVTDLSGRFYAPNEAWIHADDGFDPNQQAFENHYFYTDDTQTSHLDLPAGRYVIEATAGFEFKPLRTQIEVPADRILTVSLTLEPLNFQHGPGRWVASDLHVHMNYGGTYRNNRRHLVEQGQAEGLQIINELTVNKEQRYPDIPFTRFDEAPSYDPDVLVLQGQEFHTSYWGHRGILYLKDHLLLPGYAGYPNTAAASLYPMNAEVYDMAHEQGALVGAVHPFDSVPDPFAKREQAITDELPVDVALGKLDYMEIVGFSDHRSTAEVWYKLLDLGFRLPAGGGTDATTNYAAPIRGQVGFDRVYVWTPAWPMSIDTWMDGLKQGHTFATNGPLVEFTLGGQMVGSELKFDSEQSAIPFTARLRSMVPVDHLEVVCNGRVARTLTLGESRDSADASGSIPLKESGWCLLRAWSERAEYPVMDNYAYATTSPVYITIAGKRAYSKEAAEYFKAWIDRTIEVTNQYPDWNSPEEKQRVFRNLSDAKAVYEAMK